MSPNLFATIVYQKYEQHQPLNRKSERHARDGVELSISTRADQVGVMRRDGTLGAVWVHFTSVRPKSRAV